LSKTEYSNFEILLISNNSEEAETFEYLEDAAEKVPQLRYFEHNVPFNFSEINNWAVQHARGEYILLLNNDIEVINKGWLTAMVEHIQRPEVGAVGAKLLYPDHTIQHGGVIMKVNGVAAHAHRNLHDKSAGYFFRAGVIQNLSACTAACLLLRKSVYEEVGGMDAENLKVAFNDIDLCMKIREKGYLIVYTPYAKLYHFESKSRGSDTTPDKIDRFRAEIFFFQEKWEKFLEKGDPYYNPNLSLKSEDFSLNIE
jgi:GT2 family glycosyltransferase